VELARSSVLIENQLWGQLEARSQLSQLSLVQLCKESLAWLLQGKVLTGFYLPMGATLIQHSWKAVFGSLKSLDEAWFSLVVKPWGHQLCKESLAWFLQGRIVHSYVKNYWHDLCKGIHAQLCKVILAWILQGAK
jgi:hypothetical protein